VKKNIKLLYGFSFFDPFPLVGYGIDGWGLPSVLSALGILFSIAFVFGQLGALQDLPRAVMNPRAMASSGRS